jgi:hypothetical protein
MNLNTFVESLVAGNGATHHLSHGIPTTGAFASIHGHEYIADLPISFIRYKRELQAEMIARHVRDFIATNGLLLEQDDNYIGGWWESGKLVLDISRHFDTIEEAAEFGIHNGQRAMYSIDLDKVIDLPEPQVAGTETQRATYARLAAQAIANDAHYSII